MIRSTKWLAVASGAMVIFQLGGCAINDLLTRAAGAGAIVSGLTTLLGL